MTTQPKALGTRTKERASGNDWEKLLPLLDPAVVNAPRDKNAWKKMDRKLIVWLTRTGVQFPWLNHLALAGVIYSESGATNSVTVISALNSFLRWAIPERYPDVSSLQPTEALLAYFGDPPQPRGSTACHVYNSVQRHTQDYLGTLSLEERQRIVPFLLPTLAYTPRLSRLRAHTVCQRQAARKEQAFAVAKNLHALVVMGRRRYQWLANLDAQVQHIAELVKQNQATLPTVIQCKDLDNRQELTFRVWDRTSWIKAHREGYHKYVLRHRAQTDALFLQLVGPLPDTPWLLQAAEWGALSSGKTDAQAQQYFRDHQVAPFSQAGQGLIVPNGGSAWMLARARRTAHGTPEDSRILFYVEPLLAGAAVGLFTLVCLTQSGMRIGELQQVSGDKSCMKIGYVPQFNDHVGSFTGLSAKLFFWQLYPKGSTERQPYPVTPYMQEALKVWMEVHDRFCDSFQEVWPDHRQFTHARRFLGKQMFVLQWNGQHLSQSRIEMCLNLLLLEHPCLDAEGKPARITAHLLRHGVAGYLRQQGVPLEEIASLLHQVNVIVTDYYSKLSPQDLYAKLGPLLTRLGDVAEIDPATVRNPADLRRLEQEALKRLGILRHIPGGDCATFVSCDVLTHCAGCPAYIPDPARRDEVRERHNSCKHQATILRLRFRERMVATGSGSRKKWRPWLPSSWPHHPLKVRSRNSSSTLWTKWTRDGF